MKTEQQTAAPKADSSPSQGSANDTDRLNWMIANGTYISHSNDGEVCNVWFSFDPNDPGNGPVPVEGYPQKCHYDAREAIDAAMRWLNPLSYATPMKPEPSNFAANPAPHTPPALASVSGSVATCDMWVSEENKKCGAPATHEYGFGDGRENFCKKHEHLLFVNGFICRELKPLNEKGQA